MENNYADGEDSVPQGESKKDSQTALLPKSLCPGMKVGDTVTLKIEEIHDGDYAVSYPGEHDDEAEEERESESPEMAGPAPTGSDMGNYD